MGSAGSPLEGKPHGNPHKNPEVDDWFIGWRDFRQFLLDWQPAVGLPELFEYHQIPGWGLGNSPKKCRVNGHAIQLLLVGGLVAIFYFPIYWVCNHPN